MFGQIRKRNILLNKAAVICDFNLASAVAQVKRVAVGILKHRLLGYLNRNNLLVVYPASADCFNAAAVNLIVLVVD